VNLLANKTAIVTGGASGIGAAIAKEFTDAGAQVAIFDLQEPYEGAPYGRFFRGDVACEGDVRRAIDGIVNEHGAIDILVNNAGVEIASQVASMSSEEWDRLFDVNLKGGFLMTKHAAARLRRGGAILNISSIDAFVSYSGLAAYDASKAALLAFTRALAVELGPAGIRVNAICPGYIDTPLLQQYFEREPDPAASRADITGQHPLRRLGTPADVARCALFLASDAAAFVSGTYLTVDGGLLAAGR
jgi:NAD(P)-dependent dehydrogenase (short-subunit alcohol dehydrogenase family)